MKILLTLLLASLLFFSIPQPLYASSTSDQINTLVERSTTLLTHTTTAVKEFLTLRKHDSEKTFQESAVDYGTYLYCQQVVRKYQRLQSETSPTTSPE